MSRRKHKEVVESGWSVDHYKLIGKKGTKIYVEDRENHIPGMMRINENGKFSLERIDYLVVECAEMIDITRFRKFRQSYDMTSREIDRKMELAFHHPQVYATNFLFILEELGMIRVTWRSVSKKIGEYPFYVNPKGWQWAYNISSLIREGIYYLFHLPKKR